MTTDKELELLNSFAKKIIGNIYPEVDRIEIVLKDQRYLEYRIFLNVDWDKDEVFDELDPSYMVDVNIRSYVKSFLPTMELPIDKTHDIIVYKSKDEKVYHDLEFLKTVYDKNKFSTGGTMYRELMDLPINSD